MTGGRLLAAALVVVGLGASCDRDRILYAQGRWLYLTRADGRDKRRLVQTSFGSYRPQGYGPYDASWSLDGKRVAFVRGWSKERGYGLGVNPRAALYVINADGTGLHSLTPVRA
jgi:dipeptidyl aminopeptidase/acylaminoacyl peptidase